MKTIVTFSFKKVFFLIILVGLLAPQCQGQTVVFENGSPTPGTDLGYSVMEAPDSTLIVVGSTTTNTSGLADIAVTKMTSGGEEIWSVIHGGFNNDFPSASIMLEDGSFVIVGTTGSFTSSPSRDVYLLKMDSEGEILWTNSYGGPETDEGTDIKLTPEGDFIISAYTESYGAGETDAWLFKTDSEGNLLWDQTFGGTEMDNALGVDLSPDGGYILTGGTRSFASGSEEDLWLIKTDSAGTEIWTQTFGVSDQVDWGWDVAATDDGYVAVGIYDNNPLNPPPISGEAFFMKVDLDGSLVWNESIPGDLRVEGFSIFPTQDDGWLISGTKWLGPPSNASFWVAKASAEGEVDWEVNLGQPNTINIALDVIQTRNGDIVATGFSGADQFSTQDLHVVRLTEQTISVFESSKNSMFTAAPNPTHGPIKILLSENYSECDIKLFNGNGQVMKAKEFVYQESIELDLSLFPAGLYFLEVTAARETERIRVVKL
ncbi:T9SS type A sorting domain-containing protein [Halocola ammonii]